MKITFEGVDGMAYVRGYTLRHMRRRSYGLDPADGAGDLWSFSDLKDVARFLAARPAIKPYWQAKAGA